MSHPKKIIIFGLLFLLLIALPALAVNLKNPLDPQGIGLEGEAIYGRVINAILAFAGVGAWRTFDESDALRLMV